MKQVSQEREVQRQVKRGIPQNRIPIAKASGSALPAP